ncbi:hypothetical protein EUX98_g6517 [Antrodiella citrinella]|uniref:BRCA2 OB1 domain-containing protein n=1 Tax=Antrodiella citrinella TaxID=2447956 RepID=A0A4S4MNT0_9APHY|nr:hypothetical protein EUX98_g6517 [Antrodiella citrinella]
MHVSERLKRDQVIAAALRLKNLEPENSQEEDSDDNRPPSPSDAYTPKENRNPRVPFTDAFMDLKSTSARSPKSPRSSRVVTNSSNARGQARLPALGFGSALNLAQKDIDTSLEDAPLPPDLSMFEDDSWFESTTIPEGAAFTTFTTAKVVKTRTDEDPSIIAPTVPAQLAAFQSAQHISEALRAVTPERDTIDDSVAGEGRSSSPTGKPFYGPKLASERETTEFDKPLSTAGMASFVGFKSVATMEIPQFVGFKTAAKNDFAPTAEALLAAEQKMKQWEQEIDDELHAPSSLEHTSVPQAGSSTLDAADTSFSQSLDRTPDSPTPARSSENKQPTFRIASTVAPSIQANKKAFKSPLLPTSVPKGFRPPLLAHANPAGYVASPLNPNRSKPSETKLADAAFMTPLRPSTTIIPVTHIPSVSPQKKTLGVTPRRSNVKSKFVTPFKPGMKPGEPGRVYIAPTSPQKAKEPMTPVAVGTKGKQREVNPFLEDPPPIARTSLATSGLIPQTYTYAKLETMGINIAELRQITPQTALYYAFHTASATPFTASQVPSTAATLGTAAALDELHARGCSLATLEWVENHWALLLWKLAGMVCLDPAREKDTEKKRWCWKEVMKQLKYRYDRDLDSSARPPIRLITTHDTPPTCPMVLCVSDVIWPGSDSETNDALPRLELTDGWYRIRAELDICLARAVRNNRIRIGGKLATVGARLSEGNKEPGEPLEVYDSVSLKLTGNSTHLAPWHATLGFQSQPYVSTLRSLSSDGGVVAVMDVVVDRVYPVAYLEFVERDGKMTQDGPRDEKDELVEQDRWRKRQEVAESKLRYDLEGQLNSLSQYADRLEQKAGAGFWPTEDASQPSSIEDLLIDLEDALTVPASATTSTTTTTAAANDIVKSVSTVEAGWLARAIREKVEKDREGFGERMKEELDVCVFP